MPTATDELTTASWEGTSVDVSTIAHELARVAREAGLAAVDGNPAMLHTTRTSVMNLVVYAVTHDSVSQASTMVGELGVVHPSRSMIVHAHRDATASRLDALVTATCRQMPGSHGLVSFEEIRLTVYGELADHVDSVVTPFLLPGVPVFLWWPGDPPTQHALLAQMAEMCDRIIVDSSGFTNSATNIADLANVAQERRRQCAFSDLNWSRLTPWREVMAQLFDLAYLQPFLINPSTMKIQSRDAMRSSGFTPQSLLLVGWLSSRLNWKVNERSGDTIRCRSASREFNLVFAGNDSAGAHGVELMTIESTVGERNALITIRSNEGAEGLAVTIQLDGEQSMEHTAHFPDRADAKLLGEELEVFAHDNVYEEALIGAGSLAALA